MDSKLYDKYLKKLTGKYVEPDDKEDKKKSQGKFLKDISIYLLHHSLTTTSLKSRIC